MPPINKIHCFTRRLLPWFIYPDVYQHNRKYPESAGGSSCLRYRSKSTIIIPRDSYLLITTHEGEDVPENYKTGMWSVSRNDWILSPEPGFPVTSMADDILCSFLIGHTEYDMDFKPYEPGSETYNLENGIVLHNQMENGNYYIADSDGNPYLTAQEFFEHNHITDDYLMDSLSIEKVVDENISLLNAVPVNMSLMEQYCLKMEPDSAICREIFFILNGIITMFP